MKKNLVLMALAMTTSFMAHSNAFAAAASYTVGGLSASHTNICKEIVEIASDDVANYRVTGEASKFLAEAVKRAAKVTKQSEEDIYNQLEIEADLKAAKETQQKQ